jgi:murein DD-endopeptidase MepM/ murein hydrolase activator NlpD
MSLTTGVAGAEQFRSQLTKPPSHTSLDHRSSSGDRAAEAWVNPATGRVTNGFGNGHRGVDIANAVGTPIYAGSGGTIISSGPASGYGLWVRIQHPNNVITIYGHINESLVQVGQPVAAGQQIATMGNRGYSTGPHLHFQVEAGGRAVDPFDFYRSNGASLLGRSAA